MNCRPGDLALIVRGPRWNIGKQMTCVRLLADGEMVVGDPDIPGASFVHSLGDNPIWEVDRPVVWTISDGSVVIARRELPYCCDNVLLPIRPERDEELEREEEIAKSNAEIRATNCPVYTWSWNL